MSNNAILIFQCPDKKGIVNAITSYLFDHDANVVSLDQHIDHDDGFFFMRIEWTLNDFTIPINEMEKFIEQEFAGNYDAKYRLYYTSKLPKMAIFVSKFSHCLFDILSRKYANTLMVDIPVVISNHEDHREMVEKFGIHYEYLPINKTNKKEQELRQKEILEKYKIDFCVLARYMQVLSEDFVKDYTNKIINIHHSFLPAFPGAKPYHQAYNRGVKIIGATSHYVTSELDCGPIIAQDVVRVTHKKSANDLVMEGKNIEKIVLSQAIQAHLDRRVLVYKDRTIIFD